MSGFLLKEATKSLLIFLSPPIESFLDFSANVGELPRLCFRLLDSINPYLFFISLSVLLPQQVGLFFPQLVFLLFPFSLSLTRKRVMFETHPEGFFSPFFSQITTSLLYTPTKAVFMILSPSPVRRSSHFT